MDLKNLFLSMDGRITRLPWWIGSLILGGAMTLIYYGLFMAGLDLMTSYIVAFVVIIYPTIAVSVKRWHDRGRSGWFTIANFIPIVNIWALIQCGFLGSAQGAND